MDNNSKKGCLAGCAMAVLCFVLILILVFFGIPVYHKYHIMAESGKPISDVRFNFEYKQKFYIGDGLYPGETKSTKLITDKNGNASYFGFVKYLSGLRDMKADGYYDNRECEVGRHTIVMREKKNPVPMYFSEYVFDRITFPANDGLFSYDLIQHDFLPPYGNGEVADFVFSLKSHIDSYKEVKVSWDILFSNDRDGIQIVYTPPGSELNDSTFKGLYEAPAEGYLNSYGLAEKTFLQTVCPQLSNMTPEEYEERLENPQYMNRFENYRYRFDNYIKYNPVYYFRVRSDSGKPLYGKIYDNDGGCFRQFEPKRGRDIQLRYYLNPDGTRNMEYSSDNLFRQGKKINKR